MPARSLPDEGELRIGSITLPAGKQINAGYSPAPRPVAWITRSAVPRAGRVWSALSAAHHDTGLVPFLLDGLHTNAERPWDSEEFDEPVDPARLEHIDAARVLAEMWDGEMEDDGAEEDEEWLAMRAPFGRQFPGLAPPGETPLSQQRLDQVLGEVGSARIGLVPADRPADVLPLIGWTPSDQSDALPVAAVVRSYEERFGARLFRIGFAEISLLASRPPQSTEHAQRLAAEHFVFCDECAGRGLSDVSRITESLLRTPVWTFWWD